MKEKKRIAPARAPRRTSSRAPHSVHNEGSLTNARCRPACRALERRRRCGRIFHISNTLDSQTFAYNCFGKTSKKTHTMAFLCLQLYSFVKRKLEVPPQQRLLRAADLFCIRAIGTPTRVEAETGNFAYQRISSRALGTCGLYVLWNYYAANSHATTTAKILAFGTRNLPRSRPVISPYWLACTFWLMRKEYAQCELRWRHDQLPWKIRLHFTVSFVWIVRLVLEISVTAVCSDKRCSKSRLQYLLEAGLCGVQQKGHACRRKCSTSLVFFFLFHFFLFWWTCFLIFLFGMRRISGRNHSLRSDQGLSRRQLSSAVELCDRSPCPCIPSALFFAASGRLL